MVNNIIDIDEKDFEDKVLEQSLEKLIVVDIRKHAFYWYYKFLDN